MAKCPNCGATISASDKRCSKCGSLLSKKSNMPSSKLIIGIIAAVVIVAIVGAFASGMFNGDTSDSSVEDSTPTETVESSISEDDDSSSSSATEYWASAKADKFHTPDCEWAEKISEDNKIVYHSRDDAISDGKEPCGVCNP